VRHGLLAHRGTKRARPVFARSAAFGGYALTRDEWAWAPVPRTRKLDEARKAL